MPVQLAPTYPTPQHAQAADAITAFFVERFEIEAVLLGGSCARGKATRDSCLDIIMLASPEKLAPQRQLLEKEFRRFEESDPVVQALKQVGRYSDVHSDYVDGVFTPSEQDEAAGPDDFEVGIGNFLVYSVPLWQSSDYYSRLKEQWLPYYDEDLRLHRLRRVRHFCLNNLHHIPPYIERGLYFQSFDRLYNAYREFLQALFITRRTYPIAYNKWIREQVEEILGLPELYDRLSHLFEISRFESSELAEKALEVEEMLDEYAPDPEPPSG
jgi:predicted nucleotidyltransferase